MSDQDSAPGGQQDQQANQQGDADQSQVDGQSDQQEPTPTKVFDEKYVKELRAEAAKYRAQARNAMSESERVIAEAEERGRLGERTKYAQRLAQTQFDAEAGRRNPGFKTSDVMSYLNLSSLVSEDGEPDGKAIKAAVEKLVPPADPGPPDFDGGARGGSPKASDMNTTIRRLAGHQP